MEWNTLLVDRRFSKLPTEHEPEKNVENKSSDDSRNTLKRIMTGLFSQVLFAGLGKRRRFIRFGETYALGDVNGIEALAQLNEVDFVLVQSLFAALEVLHHSSSSSRKRDSPSSNAIALSYGVCAFL